jgi:hypothetical protein
MPCEECHLNQRDRSFSRANAAQCVDCHVAQYQTAGLRSLDHHAFGFSTACRDCHSPASFTPAVFPAHDRCFQISGGPHHGIACLDCHTSLSSPGAPGTCSTGTASCTRCHTCDRTASIHTQVPGYQCKDQKCYQCHLFVAGQGVRFPQRKK